MKKPWTYKLLLPIFLWQWPLAAEPQGRAKTTADPHRGNQAARYFDKKLEFPNYFLPDQYRDKPEAAPEKLVERMRGKIEKALESVFQRVVVPVSLEPEKPLQRVRYFPLIQAEVAKLDSEAKVFASGGVVRSGLTYLYDRIKQRLAESPKFTTEAILDEIIRENRDIPALEFRGVGSDFDLLIEPGTSPFETLKARVIEITNGASEKYGQQMEKGGVKNTLFVVGDVREYGKQTKLSTDQGGSTIDYLAFDIKDGSIKEPERFPHVMNQFVRGFLEYAPPVSEEAFLDAADTAIRGARALLELPWMRHVSEKHLRTAMKKVLEAASMGDVPSQRAIGQFAKAIRNSRYNGAHNRLYRGRKNSIEQLTLSLGKQLGSLTASNLVPEFIDSFDLGRKTISSKTKIKLPHKAFIPLNEFIQSRTNEGKLYHGTPNIENALAILREGLFVSSSQQGTAYYGRGAYSSSNIGTALGYSSTCGMMIELRVKNDPRIRVLDWARVDGRIQNALEAQAKEEGLDLFKLLARDYGVDVILHTHVLIENSKAIEFPKGLSAVLTESAQRYQKKGLNDAERVSLFASLRQLNAYSEFIGEKAIDLNPHDIDDILERVKTKDPSRALDEITKSSIMTNLAYLGVRNPLELAYHFLHENNNTDWHQIILLGLLNAVDVGVINASEVEPFFSRIFDELVSKKQINYALGLMYTLLEAKHPVVLDILKKFLTRTDKIGINAIWAIALRRDTASYQILRQAFHFEKEELSRMGIGEIHCKATLAAALSDYYGTSFKMNEMNHLLEMAKYVSLKGATALSYILMGTLSSEGMNDVWAALPEDSSLEKLMLQHWLSRRIGEKNWEFTKGDFRGALNLQLLAQMAKNPALNKRPMVVDTLMKYITAWKEGKLHPEISSLMLEKLLSGLGADSEWAKRTEAETVLQTLSYHPSIHFLLSNPQWAKLPSAWDILSKGIRLNKTQSQNFVPAFALETWVKRRGGLDLLKEAMNNPHNADALAKNVFSQSFLAERSDGAKLAAKLISVMKSAASEHDFDFFSFTEGMFMSNAWVNHPEGLPLLAYAMSVFDNLQGEKRSRLENSFESLLTYWQPSWTRREDFKKLFGNNIPTIDEFRSKTAVVIEALSTFSPSWGQTCRRALKALDR